MAASSRAVNVLAKRGGQKIGKRAFKFSFFSAVNALIIPSALSGWPPSGTQTRQRAKPWAYFSYTPISRASRRPSWHQCRPVMRVQANADVGCRVTMPKRFLRPYSRQTLFQRRLLPYFLPRSSAAGAVLELSFASLAPLNKSPRAGLLSPQFFCSHPIGAAAGGRCPSSPNLVSGI